MKGLLPLLLTLWVGVALASPLKKLMKRDPGCWWRGAGKTMCFVQRAIGFRPLGLALDPGFCGDVIDAYENCPADKGPPANNFVFQPGVSYQITAANTPNGGPTIQQVAPNGASSVVVPTTGDLPAPNQASGSATDAVDDDRTSTQRNRTPATSDEQSALPADRNLATNGLQYNGQQTYQPTDVSYQPTNVNYQQLTSQLNADGTPKRKGFDWESFLATLSTAVQSQQATQNGYPLDYDPARYGYGSGSGSDYNYGIGNYRASADAPTVAPPAAAAGVGRNSAITFGSSVGGPAAA